MFAKISSCNDDLTTIFEYGLYNNEAVGVDTYESSEVGWHRFASQAITVFVARGHAVLDVTGPGLKSYDLNGLTHEYARANSS